MDAVQRLPMVLEIQLNDIFIAEHGTSVALQITPLEGTWDEPIHYQLFQGEALAAEKRAWTGPFYVRTPGVYTIIGIWSDGTTAPSQTVTVTAGMISTQPT